MTKKGVSLAFAVIIIIALGVLVMIILSTLFSSQLGKLAKNVGGMTDVYEFCKEVYHRFYGSSDDTHKIIMHYLFSGDDLSYNVEYTGNPSMSKTFKRGLCRKYSFILGIDPKKLENPTTTTSVKICDAGGTSCVEIEFTLVKLILSDPSLFFFS
ncbi:MAG: hypothetical protein QXS41_02935 [Candidatus Woesearchaeota archaeon]